MFNTQGASCIGIDPDLFFLPNPMPRYIEVSLRNTCTHCPLFDKCLDYSLKNRVVGYWAGTTDKKREELRKFFGIKPAHIDKQYIDLLEIPTQRAINKRNSRQAQKEAS